MYYPLTREPPAIASRRAPQVPTSSWLRQHHFPIDGMRKEKKEQEKHKRDSSHSDRSNGYSGQNYYSKRRRF
ncbi:hypothetical protein AAVH_12148 [Aphelenchoides avenae]|nr:hypothetical protein AAVH_12148 [Aphelenchus avenae]